MATRLLHVVCYDITNNKRLCRFDILAAYDRGQAWKAVGRGLPRRMVL